MKAKLSIPDNAPAPDEFWWRVEGILGDRWWETEFWTPDGDFDREVLTLSVLNYRDEISEWDWSHGEVLFTHDDDTRIEVVRLNGLIEPQLEQLETYESKA